MTPLTFILLILGYIFIMAVLTILYLSFFKAKRLEDLDGVDVGFLVFWPVTIIAGLFVAIYYTFFSFISYMLDQIHWRKHIDKFHVGMPNRIYLYEDDTDMFYHLDPDHYADRKYEVIYLKKAHILYLLEKEKRDNPKKGKDIKFLMKLIKKM